MSQIINKLFVLDYNDTIVLGIEKVIEDFCIAFFGKDIYEKIKLIERSKGNNILDRYVKDESFTLNVEQLKKYWNNFEKSEFFTVLNNNKHTAEKIASIINEDLSNIKENDNLKSFCCNKILYPLIAMYNVHITGVRPEDSFKTFMQKHSNKNDELIIINTGGPQCSIENELIEYINLDNKKYEYLKYFTVNKLIFGCNELSCKRDSDRIQKLTEELKNRGYKISKNTEIILIGDTKKDIDNFEEIDRQFFPRSKIFILTRRIDWTDDLMTRKEKHKEKAEKVDKELEAIEERRKELQDIIKPNDKDKKLAKDFNEISI